MSISLFRQAACYAQDVMADLTSEDLRLGTPCGDWDAGRVVLHLADVAEGLIGLVETGHLALPEPPRDEDDDPVAVAQASVAELLLALSTADETGRAESAAQAGTIELTAHGWDLGVARDQNHATPAGLANDVLALAAALLPDDARGSNFGPRVPVPADAAPSDRLAAFLGRSAPVSRGRVLAGSRRRSHP